MKYGRRWAVVVVFATAMAWVESAVVFYLRTMIDRIDPYQPNPLPVIGSLGPVELVKGWEPAPTAASAWSGVGNAVMLLSLSIVNVS